MNEPGRTDTDSIDVAYVAHLARLQLTPEETTTFQEQLEQVVGYVRKIDELDVTGIEPTAHAVQVENVFREDKVKPGLERDRVLENAPSCIQEQFQVPKIVE
ncbi:MAG: Asp-tRNA(Asn)/Glu-tRNA(Gln) amidotransferase subunit GatC [Kiritimatiellia bacterium]|nr:Asp-tRNA(Asn)/Glu-tRNA(Gln) amidotransferase subunit GatC [Kiritimatiellia bacterium]